MSRTICYFDISIAEQPAGRITFELYDELLPKTTENFKQLCIGDKVNASGKKLAYAGSGFHRCIKGFMLQGGDFTLHNGMGGESIYGEKFEDEGFPIKHVKPMLLSMANAGPNTNGSQFFITTVPTPHLDDKHVVFGHVRSNRGLVRRIEALPTKDDKPNEAVMITAAGIMSKDDLAKEAEAKKVAIKDAGDDDIYEDYPVDEERIDAEKPQEALQVATKLKDIGTQAFKAGQYALALDKYQKALRYLDTHPVLPDDTPSDLVKTYRNTRFPLLTNAALSALKCTPPAAGLAVSLATRALSVADLGPEEKGKALYRRALGRVLQKDDEGAEKDLKEAIALVPGDAGVTKALREVDTRRKEKKEKEKKAYSKMFS